MKKQLLVGGLVLSVLGMNAQNDKTAGKNNNAELKLRVSRAKAARSNHSQTAVSFAKNGQPEISAISTSTGSWNNFSSSMNIYGVFNSNSRPLQYNPNVKAISFIQRKSGTYNATPANNSGAIVAMISQDWGANWDSTCIYSDATYPGRYPQGAIYSAPGNTVLANAYAVGSGPALSGGSWGGSWYASKQLNSFSTGASSLPNAMQMLPNTPPYPSFGKHDYSCFGFSSTDDGIVRSIGIICDDMNNLTDIRGYMVVKGTFNAGAFDWTGDSITPPTVLRTDGTHHLNFTPIMAWSQDGTIGYVVCIGARQGATGSNVGYQPIIYKTSNSGMSWSLINGIDFNSSQYAGILSKITPVSGSTVTVPYFWANEGIDATVDMNGKLHLVTTIVGTPSTHNDSLDYYETFTAEDYHWPFTPGKMPYIYDFYGDGSAPWAYLTVDSLTSEGPSSEPGYPGFNENPWDNDGGFKPRSDSRIQLSRTPDGKYIFYTWAESDPNFTTGSKHWNNIPDIKVRAYDVQQNQMFPGEPSPSKFGNNSGVISRAMFHYTSPVSTATLTNGTLSTNVPLTISNSNPYSQLSSNTHWFCNAQLTYAFTGVAENAVNSVRFNVYPNPAGETASLSLSLSADSKVSISVLNALGQLVTEKHTNASAGTNTFELNTASLSSGVYFVSVSVNGAKSTQKLIKQ